MLNHWSAVTTILLLTCLLLAIACSSEASHNALVGVWYKYEGEWQKIADNDFELYCIPASVVVFFQNGKFIMLSCLLNRNTSGTAISHSDGLTTYRGAWFPEGDICKVRYRLTSSEISASLKTRPATEETATVRISSSGLVLGKDSYTRCSKAFVTDNQEILECSSLVPQHP